MLDSIHHRGPDGSGSRLFGDIGLGHARLSIIDVAGGAQPLSNEDQSVWVTFNGEIYNYQSLAAGLKSRGHTLRTKSDTEVLVHLYEEYGENLVEHLDGMFSFAVYDIARGRLVLARDHFGIKPLFYSVRDGELVFASEIKAVLRGAGLKAETSADALNEYLMFRNVCGEDTFFAGVKRLEPGSLAIWENQTLTTRRYWQSPVPSRGESYGIEEAAMELERLLRASVSDQMMSEVPLGAYCSGGVDSGLTSYYAARESPHRLHTFSVGFKEREWDETALAQDTANRIGSDHHVFYADPQRYHDVLQGLIWNHDEPLGHPNSVLLGLLSQYARSHVTVVLTGEGSDEMFAGYPRYHIVKAAWAAGRLPALASDSISALLGALPMRKARMLARGIGMSPLDAVVMNTAYVDPSVVERITGQSPHAVLEKRRRIASSVLVEGDPVGSVSRYDQMTYLPALLDRMDRMTMAFGIEARVPFLVPRLAEFASRISSTLLTGATSNKRVVKHLARHYLSKQVVDGPKSGFGVPVESWLRTPAWSDILERLIAPSGTMQSLLDSSRVATMARQHQAGAPQPSDLMWLLTNVYLWRELDFDASR